MQDLEHSPGLTVQDVARGLAESGYSSRKKIPAFRETLSRLRKGDLRAGFYFPSKPTQWIPLPPDHWCLVDKDHLRRPKGKAGTYVVDAAEFIDDYFTALSIKTGSELVDPAELKSALRLIRKDGLRTVYIEQSGYDELVAASPRTKPPSRGKQEDESWKDVCIQSLAIAMAWRVGSGQVPRRNVLVQNLFRFWKEKREGTDLLEEATVAKAFSEARKLAESDDFINFFNSKIPGVTKNT